MMHDAESEHDIEIRFLRQCVFADSLANEFRLGKPFACLFNVVGVGIEADVLRLRQVGNDSSGAAADLEDAVTRRRPNVILYQYSAACRATDKRPIKLVGLRNRQHRSNCFNHGFRLRWPARYLKPNTNRATNASVLSSEYLNAF